MDERIHRVLDGELDARDLTAHERVRLEEYRRVLARAASAEEPIGAEPDVSRAVMARVRELGDVHGSRSVAAEPAGSHTGAVSAGRLNALTRALGWLWTPRPVAVRPAWGLAAAAIVVSVFALLSDATPQAAPVASADAPGILPAAAGAQAAPASDARIYVHFRLDAPEAGTVHLAGDFTDWQPSHELHETQPGVWTVVVPLEAGVHDYAFIVDGEHWTPDPLAAQVDDGFGGRNSRLSLLPPERMRV